MGILFFFFFQAEDGIRDYKVTGVQTCALPIWPGGDRMADVPGICGIVDGSIIPGSDRKSTRLNSSHLVISYAVFCLKKKKTLIHYRPHLRTPHYSHTPPVFLHDHATSRRTHLY